MYKVRKITKNGEIFIECVEMETGIRPVFDEEIIAKWNGRVYKMVPIGNYKLIPANSDVGKYFSDLYNTDEEIG